MLFQATVAAVLRQFAAGMARRNIFLYTSPRCGRQTAKTASTIRFPFSLRCLLDADRLARTTRPDAHPKLPNIGQLGYMPAARFNGNAPGF